jgi:ABC-type multidrug transport system ATPase subunit
LKSFRLSKLFLTKFFPPDAESALQVMDFLKSHAREAGGRRVILTIHQPSSFIWQMIDNVVLLSKGKLMYQGSRENMEAFFVKNGYPTPAGWNFADHYVTMVNDEFRNHPLEVDEWAKRYIQWEVTHELGGPKSAAFTLTDKLDLNIRSKSMVAVTKKEVIETQRNNSFLAAGELTYRYFLNLWFNPGILFTRVAMYSMLGKLQRIQ